MPNGTHHVAGVINIVKQKEDSSSDAFGTVGYAGVPTRVLYGTADRVITWPAHYTRMQRLLPEAEYVALEGLGHLPMWEDADLVARRILEVTAPERIAA